MQTFSLGFIGELLCCASLNLKKKDKSFRQILEDGDLFCVFTLQKEKMITVHTIDEQDTTQKIIIIKKKTLVNLI